MLPKGDDRLALIPGGVTSFFYSIKKSEFFNGTATFKGEDISNFCRDKLEKLCLQISAPDLPTQRDSGQVVTFNGHVHVIGGFNGMKSRLHDESKRVFTISFPGAVVPQLNALAFLEDTNEWIQVPDQLQHPHALGASALVPKTLFENCPSKK